MVRHQNEEKVGESKELIKLDDVKSIAEFLRQPATKMAEFITGILVSDTKDWKLSAGHLVQASIKWKLFKQLGKEIRGYIEKGEIKEDFLDKPQNQHSLSDLLKFIDETTPDEDRFNAMKALFIKSVANSSTEKEQILSYQFMKLCKDLESGDLLILKAAYDITNDNLSQNLGQIPSGLQDTNAQSWLGIISKQIGHDIKSLVEVHEDKLVNLKLLGPRTHSDRSGIEVTSYYRLTELGYKICRYIYKKGV